MGLYEEMETEAEDEGILEGIKEKKKKKGFNDIVNKKKLNKFELDEALNEAEA